MDDVNLNQASALILKRKAAWDGIRLEHCKLRTGELPAHRHREHVVLISLTDGCKGELITSSGIGVRGTQRRGNICVLPSGLQHQAAIEGDSQHLALYIEPALITKAASESHLDGGFEIAEVYSTNVRFRKKKTYSRKDAKFRPASARIGLPLRLRAFA